MPIQSFALAAAGWQNFYLLCGEAAATLIGLMFVAVTFGANLLSPQASATARAFIDPPFTHFVHVLVTAIMLVAPTMRAPIAGVLLMAIALLRTVALFRVFRHMRAAQAKFGDIELSDWASGVVAPQLCYLVVAASGAGFYTGHAMAFDALAIGTVALLLLGVFGAWELMLWLAMTRAQREADGGQRATRDLP